MPDVVIHHCTLNVVRRGGWSWGADPKGVARAAVAALRVLLERQLVGLWPERVDAEIAAPVRVVLPVRLSDLKAAADGRLDDNPATALGECFRAAVAQAVAGAMSMPATAQAAPAPAAGITAPRPAAADVDPRASLLKLLIGWWRRGELEGVLLSVGVSTAEAWQHTLLATPGGRSFHAGPSGPQSEPQRSSGAPSAAAVPSPRSAVRTHPTSGGQPPSRVEVLRARLLALVAAVAEKRIGFGAIDRTFAAALDREFPLAAVALEAAAPRQPSPAAGPPRQPPPAASPPQPGGAAARTTPVPTGPASAVPDVVARGPSGRGRAAGGTAHSALPFLLLDTLAKVGYLEALGALLSAADLSGEAAGFAAALAFKVLEAPERGWRRTPAALTTAALFAGLGEPVTNDALAAFARRAADFLPALDRVLSDALARGHEPAAPLLLGAAPAGGWLLAEADGLFPAAWSASWEGLLETADRFGRPLLLVPAPGADSRLFARLHGAGLRFLTDAPPVGGESWRPVRRLPHERWWTNDTAGPEGPLVAAARKLGPSAEALAACWRALAVERHAVAPGESGPLETSLALAAAVALADLSWDLWKGLGDTDPLLALERFGNLDARVQFGPDEVRVKLPLGKRSLDLAARGRLGDVVGVPWLGGRVLRFSGGSPW
jgi:hypothetical protein